MMNRRYQLCNRCVMDTTDPKISFDENGYCNHCREFLQKRAKHQFKGNENSKIFDRLIEDMKIAGRGKKYDCISGLSGGVDSCYMIYLAKQKGLRILAVHLDNGWNSQEAVINIKNVTKKLDIDYESYVLDWEEFREIQLAFLKASIPEADTPTDVAIPAALHHYAAKFGVKHIIVGGNLSTEGILPATWHYNAKDMKYFNYIHNKFGRKKLRSFPTFGFGKEMYYKVVRGIKMIYPLNYVDYVKKDVIKLIQEKLGGKAYGAKHHESIYTKFIQSYYLYEKFGIDYRRATYSSQICLGDMERSTALEKLEVDPFDPGNVESEKQFIAKKLQISREEFERILNLPAKWYWDYPNDHKKLSFIYDSYRKLYNKEKLGSF